MALAPAKETPISSVDRSNMMFKAAIAMAIVGQFPDLVDVSGQYLPEAEVADIAPAEVQVASYDLVLNVPIPLGERTLLIPGLTYHVDAVSFVDLPEELVPLRAFHAPELSVLFVQLLDDQWSLSLRLAGGIASDVRAFDAGVLRGSAVALATYAFSDRLVLGGGGLVSYGFGSLLPLPAIYVDWKPWENLQFEAFLPAFADVRYTFSERVEVGLHVEIAGNQYAVRNADIRNAWPCAPGIEPATTSADRSQCFDHLSYAVGTAGLAVGVRLFSSVWFRVLGGYSFYRRFDQYNADHELLPGGRHDLPGVFMVRSQITWRIPRS